MASWGPNSACRDVVRTTDPRSSRWCTVRGGETTGISKTGEVETGYEEKLLPIRTVRQRHSLASRLVQSLLGGFPDLTG